MAITSDSLVVGLHLPGLFTPGEHGYPEVIAVDEQWQDHRLGEANPWGPGRTALIEKLAKRNATVLITRGSQSYDHTNDTVSGMEAVVASGGSVQLTPVQCAISSLGVVRNITSKTIGGYVRELNSPAVRAGVRDREFMPWLLGQMGINHDDNCAAQDLEGRPPVTRAFLFGSEGMRFVALEGKSKLRPIRQMTTSPLVSGLADTVKALMAEKFDDPEIFAAVDITQSLGKMVPLRVAVVDPVLVSPVDYRDEGGLQAQLLADQLVRVAETSKDL